MHNFVVLYYTTSISLLSVAFTVFGRDLRIARKLSKFSFGDA